jgi:hypothetical protein
LAGETIAGVGTMAPAANPETDLRKSRRFIEDSNTWGNGVGAGFAKFVPNLNGVLKSR